MDGFIGEMMMTEYAPFKVGDYIPKYNVTTREGSAQYRRMAEFCNRMGYVIEEREIEQHEFSEDLSSHEIVGKEAVYMICELPQPEPPSHEDELRQELAQIDARFRELEYIGTKIATGRGTREEYASEIAEMQRLADRKNEINRELAAMQVDEAKIL